MKQFYNLYGRRTQLKKNIMCNLITFLWRCSNLSHIAALALVVVGYFFTGAS